MPEAASARGGDICQQRDHAHSVHHVGSSVSLCECLSLSWFTTEAVMNVFIETIFFVCVCVVLIANLLSEKKKRKRKATPKKPRRVRVLYYGRGMKVFKGRSLNRQFCVGIFNVFNYFLEEKRNNDFLRPLAHVMQRTADAVGLGRNAVARVVHKGEMGKTFLTPAKKNKRPRPKRDLDDFTKTAIRSLVYEFHQNRLHFTLKSLKNKIVERGIDFFGNITTLGKLLREIGFRFTINNGIRYLLEKPRIVLLRLQFMRRFKKILTEGKKQIIYLDETWMFQNGSGKARSWQDFDVRSCPRRKASSGPRYIVLHAGGREGFVRDAGLVYSTTAKPRASDDYHGDMNGTIFLKWFKEKLLPNLDKPTVIVMDNASYHSSQEDDSRQPTTKFTKAQLLEWLKNNNVVTSPDMTRKELLALCRIHKKPKRFVLDELLKGTEHEILRLPPYHCMFNPIEMVWGEIKPFYERHVGRNNDYSIDMLKTVFTEVLNSVTPEKWARYCRHTENLILETYEKEVGRCGEAVNDFKLVIDLDDDDSDSEEEWEGFQKNPDDPERLKPTLLEVRGEGVRKNLLSDSPKEEGTIATDVASTGEELMEVVILDTAAAEPTDTTASNMGTAMSETSGQLVEIQVHCTSSAKPKVSVSGMNVLERTGTSKADAEAALMYFNVAEVSAALREPIEFQGDIITVQDILKLRKDTHVTSKFNLNVTVDDLPRLWPSNWLNDELVNFYFAMIAEESCAQGTAVYAFNSFFFPKLMVKSHAGVKRWTKKVDLFSFEIVILPIHLGCHWCLCVVKPRLKRIEYFDSYLNPNDECMEVILIYLSEEFQAKGHGRFDELQWTRENMKEVTEQLDGHNCGVFMCLFARRVCEGKSCLFKANLDAVRVLMIKEIVSGGLHHLPIVACQRKVEKARVSIKRNSGEEKGPKSKVMRRSDPGCIPSNDLPVVTTESQDVISASEGRAPERKPSATAVTLPVKSAPKMVEVRTDLADVLLAQSGRISQLDKSFGERSNSQCTAITTFSIPALSSWGPPFSIDHLDSIVRGGDEYYSQCKEFASDHPWLCTDELLPDISVGSLRVHIEVLQCGEGNFTSNAEVDLRSLVSTFKDVFSHLYPTYGFIFIGHGKTVSFLPASKDTHRYWFFNSHAVSTNNDVCLPGRKGASRLFHAYSVAGLVRLLLRGHPRDNQYWQVYMISYYPL